MHTDPILTSVAGSNLLLDKVSDSPKLFTKFFFPNSVFMCAFLGLWSGFINPPPQFNQPIFRTNIWTALFERADPVNTLKEKPPRLRCRKMPKIWEGKSAEMSCVHFTELLDLLRHYLKKFQELRILRKSSKNRDFFLEQTWCCDQRDLLTLTSELSLFRAVRAGLTGWEERD